MKKSEIPRPVPRHFPVPNSLEIGFPDFFGTDFFETFPVQICFQHRFRPKVQKSHQQDDTKILRENMGIEDTMRQGCTAEIQ